MWITYTSVLHPTETANYTDSHLAGILNIGALKDGPEIVYNIK